MNVITQSVKSRFKKKFSSVDKVPRNPMLYITPNTHKHGNNPSGTLTASVAFSETDLNFL